MDIDYLSIVKVFKALCDENRLKVVEILKDGEKCACTLLEKLEISQPTLSHHMKILIDSAIVESRKDGRWTYYSLSINAYNTVDSLVNELLIRSENYQMECTCNEDLLEE